MTFFTERMKKIELAILKSDVDSVMRYLGSAGCLQLIAEHGREQSAGEREIADLRGRVEAIARFLDVAPAADGDAPSVAPDRLQLRGQAQDLAEALRGLIDEEAALLQRKITLRQTAEELADFARLGASFSDLQALTFLTVRVGTVSPDRIEELSSRLRSRALVVRLGRPGHFLAVAPKKSRWALDSELKRVECQETGFPRGMKGVPAEMLAAVQADLAGVEGSLARLEEKKKAERDSRGEEIRVLLHDLDLDVAIDSLTLGQEASGSIQKVTGWIPLRRFPKMAEDLSALTKGRMALRAFDPEELPEVKAGKVKVPVSTPNGRLVRSFERMVFSYSIPLYGTVNPTPFVAVMFVLLFAIMFGDMGQGLVGLLLGLLINSGRVKSFERYRARHFGTTFMIAGFASMVSGFLYGSFFASETFLVPAERFVSRLILGHPVDRFISLVGFQKIFLFFGVTIGIGALINSVGLVINIINTARRREWAHALLSKTGLAGAVFFWYALSVAVRIVLGGRIGGLDFVLLAIPLLVLFFHEPLSCMVEGHRPLLPDGLFAFIMQGIVEILESTIYYVSNSVSFLRVAAFALAHAVLSTIVFLLSDMVGGAPGGIVFRVLVVLIGNSIIIVLEGLIVTIQVVRLQYYEFFSKFFTESGVEFRPFNLRASGGKR